MDKGGLVPHMGMETLHHLSIDAEGLNKDLVYPYRAVIEASIKGENKEWPLMKNILAAFFASRMREYGKKKPKYTQYIAGVNELGVLAREGKKVNTIINTLVFDYQKLWVGIDIITNRKILKNAKSVRGLELYPVTCFPSDLKKYFLYQAFEEAFPGLMRVIIKNRLMVYLTNDFHFAINYDLLNIAGVNDLVEKRRHGDVIDLNDGVKLYLVEGI